jgi:hypothetical protein
MGAFLAMIDRYLRHGAAIMAVLALTACGSLEQGSMAAQLGQGALRLAGQLPPPAAPAALASDADLRANPDRFMRVHVRATGQSDIMMMAGQNGTRTTWIDRNGISITTQGGVVVATRGLPRDLMGADVTQTLTALQFGGVQSQRRHDFLDDQDQISAKVLQCRIASDGPEQVTRGEQTRNATRYTERCTSDSLSFTNIYWIDRQDNILRSLQAVSPDAGYLQIDLM